VSAAQLSLFSAPEAAQVIRLHPGRICAEDCPHFSYLANGHNFYPWADCDAESWHIVGWTKPGQPCGPTVRPEGELP
jgi:hypothetical protein